MRRRARSSLLQPVLLALLTLMLTVPLVVVAQELTRDRLSDSEAVGLAAAGADAYERGDFTAAEEQYRRLVQGGRDSAAAYYNLGNSLYRLGRTGESILAWERARRRAPADRGILENLEFAGGRITDRVAGEEDSDPLRALWRWHGRIPPAAATSLFLISWWIFHACLAGALFLGAPRLRRLAAYLLPIVLLGVLCSGAVLGLLVYRRDVVLEGIVQPARADLLSAPGEGAVRLTTIHEGLKVRLRSRRGDWLEVLLPNGLRGWLPSTAVAPI
jgi:tetratricopeptide (TPR) repeat protein